MCWRLVAWGSCGIHRQNRRGPEMSSPVLTMGGYEGRPVIVVISYYGSVERPSRRIGDDAADADDANRTLVIELHLRPKQLTRGDIAIGQSASKNNKTASWSWDIAPGRAAAAHRSADRTLNGPLDRETPIDPTLRAMPDTVRTLPARNIGAEGRRRPDSPPLHPQFYCCPFGAMRLRSRTSIATYRVVQCLGPIRQTPSLLVAGTWGIGPLPNGRDTVPQTRKHHASSKPLPRDVTRNSKADYARRRPSVASTPRAAVLPPRRPTD
jgi:hypothetical protein